METKPLKLADQQFPFSCSLYKQVQDRYAWAAQAAMQEQSMEPEEVLGYLRRVEDFTQGPMEAIRALTEAFGDPSLPPPAQVAILEWLQDAYALWTENFPIEEPLASELRKLLPIIASQAISDTAFLKPGAHPLHRLLDTIQNSAVGWQAELGRAGQALEQLVATVITDTSAWLQSDDRNLDLICEQVIAKAIKDQARAQRMTQRLVETEQGRLRTASARWKSADMINQHLETHQATEEIGEFLKGPWFESAQLVLLKFGADSQEWSQMGATTKALLDSLVIEESEEEDSRQQLFETVTRIPKEVKRWLLSLQMDSGAVSEAIGPIEVTHLSLLRQQPIRLIAIEPLQVEGMASDRATAADLETIASLEQGQWFAVDEDNGGCQRVQLVLKLGQEQQLWFANKAGIKAMQQDYENFCALLSSGKARPLRSGSSFSICLANAAGIETLEDAQALTDYTQPDQPAEQPQATETQAQQEEFEEPVAENDNAVALKAEQEQAERIQHEEETQRLQAAKEEAERVQREQEEEAQRLQSEQEEAEKVQREREEEAQRLQAEKEEAERVQREREEQAQRLQAEKEEAERVQREREEQAQRLQAEKEEAERIQREQEEEAQRKQADKDDAARSQMSKQESELLDDSAYDVEIHLTMGTWLGFHDGSTPMMAKLAVHDREQDSYIFVNREGIKMRSLNKRELIDLMENNYVEILEIRSSFRDKVTQVKKDQN